MTIYYLSKQFPDKFLIPLKLGLMMLFLYVFSRVSYQSCTFSLSLLTQEIFLVYFAIFRHKMEYIHPI